MLFRIGIAVFLSFILIGGAVWIRIEDNKTAPALIGASEAGSNSGLDYADAYWPENDPSETPPEDLSTTDLISRQLILDYVSLASNGPVSKEALDRLADQYVDSIASINSSTRVSLAEIKTVADTKLNFQTYDKITTEIEIERAESIRKAYRDNQEVRASSPQFYLLAGAIGSAYEEAALKLKELVVPASIASLHTNLVNNYFSTASGMKAVSETENDSTLAFAGMVSANQSILEERRIVDEIIAILIKNGV